MRPIHTPHPYEDEAVSSWLSRIAALHAMSLDELTMRMDLQSADADLSLAPGDVAQLQNLTLAPSEVVRLLPLDAHFPLAEPSDLIARDTETGLRGQVCCRCLEEDTLAGRDHYVRRDWLLAWTATCVKHGEPLQEISSIDVVPRHAGGRPDRVVRFSRAVDEVINPYRVHDRSAGRAAQGAAQAGFLSAAISEALRGNGNMEEWDCAGHWPASRAALVALSDLLVHRPGYDGLPLYGLLLGQDVPVKFWLWSPSQRIMPRLTPGARRVILEALSCLLMAPQTFSVIGMHADGPGGFYTKFRSASPRFRGPLAQVAALDPLAPVLALAPTGPLSELIAESHAWPERLKVRLSHAAAVALAATRI